MFSKPGTYKPVGMFSATHIVVIILCFALIGLCVFLTRKMTKQQYFKCVKVFAIIITAMEVFKIVWSLCNGETSVNNWVPLYFCSIFIFAMWFACSKNEVVKNLGLSYIASASIVGGAVFIISPSTSFNSYPIFHFLCIHSMVYHSIMVYMGVMLYVTKATKIDWSIAKNYCLFCLLFMICAQTLNLIFDGNLMFINKPYGIPLPFLFDIYDFSHAVYTILVSWAHIMLGVIAVLVYKGVVAVINQSKQNKISSQQNK